MIEGTGARRGRRWTAPARTVAVAAALAGTALLSVACGVGGPASTTGADGTNETTLQQSLNSSGVFVENPSNNADFKAPASARQACGHLLPKRKTLTPAQQASANRANLALAACMRRHGYPKFPDSWGAVSTSGNSPASASTSTHRSLMPR